MKNLLFILILVGIKCFSQDIEMVNTSTKPINFLNFKAGSCSSPDGPTTEIDAPPPNYEYLFDNGYCLYSYNTTSEFTACFTFIAGTSSITLNAGSSTNCNNRNFSNFRLYNNSCTLIGTGLTFTGLTSGQEYTWCLTMRANGGGGCTGFTTFCPYYTNNIVLPIQLLSFTAKSKNEYNLIQWSTTSETNNDRFILNHSDNGFDWRTIEVVQGAGNSTSRIDYYFEHRDVNPGVNYYRLTQIDFDGTTETFPLISIDNRNNRFIVKSINTLGQEIQNHHTGIIINVYNDGSTEKVWK